MSSPTTPDPEKSSTSLTQTQPTDENDEEIDKNNRQRFVAWAALLLVSCVALASKVAAATAPYDRLTWILFSVSITSIVCSFISVLGYALSPHGFFGSVFEGFFAVVCQIVWIVGMPFIMDPDRDIAVSKVSTGEGTELTFIRNANIYFFSWASTICIVCVCGRFVRQLALEKRKRTQDESNRDVPDEEQRASPFLFSPRTSFWFLLTLASLVVLVDATEIFLAFSCEDKDSCMRTRYALSLGAVGTFLSLGCSVLATCGLLNTFFELLFSFFLLGLYLAGVALITFGDGPGASLGNLYFATWMGAAISTVLLGRSFQGIIRHGFQSGSEHQAAKPAPTLQTANETTKPEEPHVFPDIEMGNVDTSEENNNPFDVDSPVAAKEEVAAPVAAGPAVASSTDSSEEAEIELANTTPDEVIVEAEVVTQAEEEEEESGERSTPDEVVVEAEGVTEADEESVENDQVEEVRSFETAKEEEKSVDEPVEDKQPDMSDSEAKEEEKEEKSVDEPVEVKRPDKSDSEAKEEEKEKVDPETVVDLN